jgi:hypothetical protein
MADFNQIMSNPAFIAGLNMIGGAGGTSVGNHLANAAQLQLLQQEQGRHQQQQQYKQMQDQRQMELQQALPEILSRIDPNNPQQAFGEFARLGFTPQEASVILKSITPDINESVLFNPVTGEREVVRKQGGRIVGGGGSGLGNPIQGQAAQGFAEFNPGEIGGQANVQPYENPKLAQERMGREAKESEEDSAELNSISEAKSALKGMRKDLKKIAYTGPGAETAYKYAPLATSVIGDVGGTAAAEDFSAKSFDLIAPKIQQMKGALSDKDVQFLLKQIPSLGKSKAGNESILKSLEAQFSRAEKMITAKKAYRKKFGTTEGFQERWKGFVDANPLTGGE